MNPNPTIDDVKAAFNKISPNAKWFEIDRAGVTLPSGGHFQGIQRLPTEPPLMVLTSDSDTVAYFVACTMWPDVEGGRAYSPVILAWSPLNHAGGCQAVGNYLVVGIEDPDKDQLRVSEVQFWDFTRFPTQLIPMTIPRSGPVKEKFTAGAVGLTYDGKGGSALAVGTYNSGTIDFYVSEADPFAGSPFTFTQTWDSSTAYMGDWIDKIWGGYQSLNLITQTDGELFMVGTYRNSNNWDWMDLYSVDPVAGSLIKVATKHMICTHGCDFSRAAGIFIPSSAGFEVYAAPEGSGDHKSGTTIYVNHFTA